MGSRVDMKIVLLGKENGGKTSLVERYINNVFKQVPYQSTIGAAFGAKKIDVNGKVLTIGVWDTAGSERYEAMSKIYYRDARAAIVCYDLTDKTSFERAKFWVNEIRSNEERCKIYFCGTKKDLVDADKRVRDIDYHTTTDYADECNAQVFETSSKSGENIRELFYQIALDYSNDPKLSGREHSNEKSIKLSEKKRKTVCGCS